MEFEQALRSWVAEFCQTSGQQPPDEKWYGMVRTRLPHGLRQTLELGLQSRAIIPLAGGRFTLAGLPANRAFNWFARAQGRSPWINWEWFVHAAEYARIRYSCARLGVEVKFEHERMDVAVYRGGRLFACYEVKESARKLDALISAIGEWGEKGVELNAPDRNNDSLRKAKYLVRHKPLYFSGVAIGKRYEFSVEYVQRGGNRTGFDLLRDVIPPG